MNTAAGYTEKWKAHVERCLQAVQPNITLLAEMAEGRAETMRPEQIMEPNLKGRRSIQNILSAHF